MENTNDDTSNFLNWVEIKNFKSIKDLRLDCKRVNIFIGKPNVGKSNILEGLGMLSSQGSFYKEKFFSNSIRYEYIGDLFFENNRQLEISVASDWTTVWLTQRSTIGQNSERYKFAVNRRSEFYSLSDDGEIIEINFSDDDSLDGTVKKYDYLNLKNFKNSFDGFLLPPHGNNLYSVINSRSALWDEFAKLFIEQDLEFILDERGQTFVLQKQEGHKAKQYPYFAIADTFRRYIFYITAIESNKNSVIIFEEPEVHSFPPYTQELAYRMIYDESNQYFISTHSPYMLHPFIEKMDYKDLNVFVTYYKDYQTHVRALTEEELTDILDFSTNVFFNLSRFEPHA